MMTQYNSK